eukprot:scaffold273_cov242-Pinguiococcus_pyrenoidosus.AAC.45
MKLEDAAALHVETGWSSEVSAKARSSAGISRYVADRWHRLSSMLHHGNGMGDAVLRTILCRLWKRSPQAFAQRMRSFRPRWPACSSARGRSDLTSCISPLQVSLRWSRSGIFRRPTEEVRARAFHATPTRLR